MDAQIIAERSIERARVQHVHTFRGEDAGDYRSHSKTGEQWYAIEVIRAHNTGAVIVQCSCPGGTYYRDEHGTSLCKHAAGVSKRLVRRPLELAAIVAPTQRPRQPRREEAF